MVAGHRRICMECGGRSDREQHQKDQHHALRPSAQPQAQYLTPDLHGALELA